METIEHLLICFSTGFQDKQRLCKVVDTYLERCLPESITLINDQNNIFESEQIGFTGKLLRKEIPITRLECKKLVARCSHILAFWSGEDISQIIWETKHQKKPLRISTFYWTRAVNKDREEEYDIYIGRRTPWGNPFHIDEKNGETREIVIEKYKEYFKETILTDPIKQRALLELRGLRLGCHCKPLACHGDVIADYLNNYRESDD